MTEPVPSNAMPLPCPHCGAQVLTDHIPAHKHTVATFMPDAPDTFVIECACGAGMCGHETMNDVVERWNKRTAPEPCECQHLGTIDLEDAHARWCTECGAFHDGTQWVFSRQQACPTQPPGPVLALIDAAIQWRKGPPNYYATNQALRDAVDAYSGSTKESAP